jgi:riboflavin kinase/FMN adenylyltransferase
MASNSLALGFFDGLHLGHKVVLKNAMNIAKEKNGQSTVIVFKEHPINYLTENNVPLILTLDEKLQMLKDFGIDNVVLLDFKDYSHIKATDYLENVLCKYFTPIAITTGFNHYFGFNKEGNSDFLRKNQLKYNFTYYEVPPFVMDSNIVSCSTIRNFISLGDFNSANKLLGYKFFIQGSVIKGEKLASRIGFPSANINYPEEKIKMPYGVYFVIVTVDGVDYNGILNFGASPTFDNIDNVKTEVHILDFDQEIYGKNIKISFVTKIRNQQKFENVEKLKTQIQRDIAFVNVYKCFLNSHFDFSCKNFLM